MYNDMAQLWVRSSPGRAPPWHGGGSEFDPRRIHHKCPLPVNSGNIDKKLILRETLQYRRMIIHPW